MSEIKFACPGCNQHIICDGDYGGIPIECPSCRQTMLVPKLKAFPQAHPQSVVVASKPPAFRPQPSNTSAMDWFTGKKWAEHYRDSTDGLLGEISTGILVTIAGVLVMVIGLPLIGLAVLFAGCGACGM